MKKSLILPFQLPRSSLKVFAVGIIVSAIPMRADALTISNGDFESAAITRVAATTDPDFITYDLITSSGWYTSNNQNKTFLLSSGGPLGLGSYGAVQANGGAPGTGNHRGIVYAINDNHATTGVVTMTFDSLILDVGTPNLLVKVFGVNDSDALTPGIQWDGVFDLTGPQGNFDALNARDIGQTSTSAPSYTGSSFSQLYFGNAAGLGITFGTTWNEGIEFSFDLGSGYDQIIIGFAIHDSPNSAPFDGIDNLAVVPEPSTVGFCVAGVLGGVALVRRRSRPGRSSGCQDSSMQAV